MLNNYRSEIDGLRAVAVLPVMLYHADLQAFSGGYVGVDVFFVISGFLITSIISREVDGGRFSILKFYERRTRRILPALYFLLLACWVPAWFLMVPDDFILFAQTALGTLGFVANIVLWQELNYFSPGADYIPLIHMWSLAVEEQFYLLLPIALLISLRLFGTSRRATLFLIPTALASIFLCEYFGNTNPSANYYLLPTRAWELLIGALLALQPLDRVWPPKMASFEARARDGISALGLCMIISTVFLFDKSTPFPSLWALIPTLGTVMVIANSRSGGLTHRLLSTRILVGVGLISFSAYLWHQPIYAFIRLSFAATSPQMMAAGFVGALVLAFFSWRFVEKPFRDGRSISPKSLWMWVAGSSLLILILGVHTIRSNGFPDRFQLPGPLANGAYDLPKSTNGWCFYSVDNDYALKVEMPQPCTLGSSEPTLRALLFGDSFAGMYEPFWHEVGESIGIQIQAITTNWCYPSFGSEYAWHTETRAYDQCLLNRSAVEQRLHEFDVLIVGSPWSTLNHRGRLNDAISTILDAAQRDDLRIVVMPEAPRFSGTSIKRAIYMNGPTELNPEGEAERLRIHALMEKRFSERDNILLLNPDLLFHAGDDRPHQFAYPISLDGQHISIYGSIEVARLFLEQGGDKKLLRFLAQTPPTIDH